MVPGSIVFHRCESLLAAPDRIGCHQCAVDRAYGGSDDQVGVYANVAERLKHAHLLGSEAASTSQHEADGPR